MAITYHFDLYPRDDPRDGTRLVRFTQLQSAEYSGEANGTGAGRISLRGSSVDAAYIDPLGLQYVRVVRDDGSTEVVVGGFFLDNGDYAALTTTGNELLTFGGAGTLSYLARAQMWSHTYESWGRDPFDDLWRLYAQSSVYAGGDHLGSILWRVIDEAQKFGSGPDGGPYDDDRTESAIPDVVLGFDGFNDSNSNAWSVTSGEFKAQVGENVLAVVKRLMEAGLYVSLDPDTFELNAWENGEHRRDRTGASWGSSVVRFQAPIGGDIATGNIKSDAKRGIQAFVKRSAILAGGQDVFGLSTTGGSDIPWEGFYPADVADQTALEGIATTQLGARSDAGDTVRLRMKLASDPSNGRYLPFEHVQLDDLVTVHTGTGQWDWNEAELPVAALTVMLRQGGDWDAWVDLGSTYSSMAERRFQVPAIPQAGLLLCNATVAGDAAVEGGAANTTGGPPPPQTSVAFTVTGGVDLALYGFVQYNPAGGGGGGDITSVVWQPDDTGLNDQAMTLVGSVVNGGTTVSAMAVYRLLAPNSGTGTILVTTGGANSETGIGAVLLSGVDQTTPEGTIATNSGTSSTTSVTASAPVDGIVINAGGWLDSTGGGVADPVAVSGQTSLDASSSTGTVGTGDVAIGIGWGDATPGWTLGASHNWCAIAVPVNSSGGANPLAGTSNRAARCDHNHYLEELATLETDTTLVPHPDGSGGVEWGADSGGAPVDATYLVTTANGTLTNEVVVGTTPGGELGGTWASPTVDSVHSGSAHLALGTTGSTAAAGNHTHAASPPTAFYRPLMDGAGNVVTDGATGEAIMVYA